MRSPTRRCCPPSLRRKLGHTVLGRGADIESLYLNNFYCAFGLEEQHKLLNREFHSRIPTQRSSSDWNSTSASPTLPRLLFADQKTYLVELLMKQDQMSMATSIESRVPFLDHKFVEFAASVPPHMKLRGKQGKYIMKKAVEDLLPHDIIYRKKMGFPTPITAWLLREEAVLHPRLPARSRWNSRRLHEFRIPERTARQA